MSEKVIVKFTKPWRGYSPGEVAGFEESVAEALVGGGVASGYSPASAAASVSSPLSDKRVRGTDRKPAGRAGASKPPAAELQTSTVGPTTLELSQETLDPGGVTGGDASGERGEGESDQATGTGADVDTDPVDGDDDDEGKP